MADTTPAFFESLYRRKEDPWNFRSTRYEQHRYATVTALLGEQHFEAGFEPGSAEGELTSRLAPYCHTLVTLEAAPTAVERARSRLSNSPNVTPLRGVLPQNLPDQDFDLIVFSELGYYFEPVALTELVTELRHRMPGGGTFLSCHWLGTSADHRIPGTVAHRVVRQVLGVPAKEIISGTEDHQFKAARWDLSPR